ncbi:MAG: Tat pathway signal protein [Sphingomonadales bacterium 32-68-7]|nr:MAG: Tat pathway signal protein [Sphingomonadales bacterium 12-68-11]OYX10099.1 MAG: Tat pathway signal protein [Sphingomonadales bacterium 32-68-7]
MHIGQNQSRRAFLKRSSALGLAGVATPLVTSLAGIGEAAAATATDYKALVCVFLYGGNDYANTLPPVDAAGHAAYLAARPGFAHPLANLAATTLNPSVPLAGGRQYALAPSMGSMLPLFNAGKLAVMLNVGTLVEPTSKAAYQANSVRLPPKLFSHNDQQSYFQASNPEGATSGWGGRMGDLLQSGNGASALTCINASGNAIYLTGRTAVQYSIGSGGPIALLNRATTLYGSATAATTLRSLMSTPAGHMFGDEHAKVGQRALDTYAQVSTALAGAPATNFPLFPTGNSLADQLRIVARMISVSAELGAKRQVFFVSLGGFDLHDAMATSHPVLMARVSDALRAFYDTTVALGVQDRVTAFTASDFGRTLQSNEDGSDHGWGSMHFALGGAVQGGRFYGSPPAVGNNTPDDVGQGRLIPTMSVDQYAATLARWFGVSNTDLLTVVPNIANYNPSTWNLGFV